MADNSKATRAAHMQTLLKIMQAAQLGDEQAQEIVRKNHAKFVSVMPQVEAFMRETAPASMPTSDQELVKGGVPADKVAEARAGADKRSATDVMIENNKDILNRLAPEPQQPAMDFSDEPITINVKKHVPKKHVQPKVVPPPTQVAAPMPRAELMHNEAEGALAKPSAPAGGVEGFGQNMLKMLMTIGGKPVKF